MPGFASRERKRRRFDRAVVYFDSGAFFEAHEDWETLWHEADGHERVWLQGLIQIAAAFVHFERGFHASGFVKLLHDGRAKAAPYDGDTYGIRLDLFLRELERWQAHAARVREGAPLRDDAPLPLPHFQYREGIVPDPLDPDEDDEAD